MMFCFYLLILAQHAVPTVADLTPRQTANFDVLDWIDPLIGSRNGGNVFAGATLPYGMAKGQKHSIQYLAFANTSQLLRT